MGSGTRKHISQADGKPAHVALSVIGVASLGVLNIL